MEIEHGSNGDDEHGFTFTSKDIDDDEVDVLVEAIGIDNIV